MYANIGTKKDSNSRQCHAADLTEISDKHARLKTEYFARQYMQVRWTRELRYISYACMEIARAT